MQLNINTPGNLSACINGSWTVINGASVGSVYSAGPNGGITVNNTTHKIDRTTDICLASGNCVPTGIFDLRTSTASFPAQNAATDPLTCSVGQKYYNTTSNKFKNCTATDTWVDEDTGGGGGITYTAGTSGGISINNTSHTVDTTSAVCLTTASCIPTNVFDLRTSTASYPAQVAASDPATCAVGRKYYNSTTNKFRNCTSTNTWTDENAGAAGCTTPGIAGAVAYYPTTDPCPAPSGILTGAATPGEGGIMAMSVGTVSADDVTGRSGFRGATSGGGFLWQLPGTDAAGAFVSDGSNAVSLQPFSGTGNIAKVSGATVSDMTCTSGCTGFGSTAVSLTIPYEPIWPVLGDSVGNGRLLSGSGVGSGAGTRAPVIVPVTKVITKIFAYVLNGTGNAAMGVYDTTGAKVCATPSTTLVGSSAQTFTFSGTCTLTPGVYYFVTTSDNGSASIVVKSGYSAAYTALESTSDAQTAAYVGHSTTSCVATGSGGSLALNASISGCTWVNSGPGADAFFYLGWGN